MNFTIEKKIENKKEIVRENFTNEDAAISFVQHESLKNKEAEYHLYADALQGTKKVMVYKGGFLQKTINALPEGKDDDN